MGGPALTFTSRYSPLCRQVRHVRPVHQRGTGRPSIYLIISPWKNCSRFSPCHWSGFSVA